MRIEGPVPAPVVDDVGPDLQDPQASNQSLVDGSAGELGQVVDVTSEGGPAIAGEVFG